MQALNLFRRHTGSDHFFQVHLEKKVPHGQLFHPLAPPPLHTHPPLHLVCQTPFSALIIPLGQLTDPGKLSVSVVCIIMAF